MAAALAAGAPNRDAKPAYRQQLKLAEPVKLDGGGQCEVWDLEVAADVLRGLRMDRARHAQQARNENGDASASPGQVAPPKRFSAHTWLLCHFHSEATNLIAEKV